MTPTAGNLLAEVSPRSAAEDITPLVATPHMRIERIVSQGHASPPDFWYDQDRPEWVLLVSGAAALRIEGEAQPRQLTIGDHVLIPAHVRHRVEWTAADQPTIWLAIHYTP
jgi:cupin 2 domain-containing protein